MGTKSFVEKVKDRLGSGAIGRSEVAGADGYKLREVEGSYGSDFGGKMCSLSSENAYRWDEFRENPET